ncbi:Lipid A biosynthesis lauroyltransferase [termite gut metagenome]|uniref:Lipid A biosynthesis lauroyltransferase n=1 Tax=termite gut metagenome TaxID=433724 RepID=A0A5J4SV90_9ZZZZ
MKRLIHEIIYGVIYATVYIVSLLPMTVLYTISDLIYLFVYYIFAYRKEVVIQNLSRSFPQKKYDEIHSISKRFYKQFIDNFAEILKMVSISSPNLKKRILFVGLRTINELLAREKNVIACLGHCGNWEMLNILPDVLQTDVYAVYKPLSNKIINRLMMKLRSRFGIKPIASRLITKHILNNKNHPALYLFIADQCPEQINNRYLFLNQDTGVFNGVEKLACTSESAVVYLHLTQISRGYYQVVCMPICLEPAVCGEKITEKYLKLLGKNIEEEPFIWLWSHKRWKR